MSIKDSIKKGISSITEARKYEVIIWLLISFILIYVTLFVCSERRNAQKEIEVRIQYEGASATNLISTDSSSSKKTILLKESQTDFSEGDMVAIKHMGIIGVVNEKILGIGGYSYEVMFKQGDNTLTKEVFHSWMLYKPSLNEITTLTPLQ